MAEWVEGRLQEVHNWNPYLHSLKIAAEIDPFEAGQYARLALDVEGTRVARPYSFVNSPHEPVLEFHFNTVPEGPLSGRLAALAPGSKVWLAKKPAGYLTLSEVPNGKDLWLLATGTAIGPFLSILRTDMPWVRFERVVLAYAVRHEIDLAYRDALQLVARTYPERFEWIPFISRESCDFAMSGRIPAAIESGRLEQHFDQELDASRSQVMICGNPHMVKDTVKVLESRGLQQNLRRTPGQVSTENYW